MNELRFNRELRIAAEKKSNIEKFSAVDNLKYLHQNKVDCDTVFFLRTTTMYLIDVIVVTRSRDCLPITKLQVDAIRPTSIDVELITLLLSS